MDNNAALRVSEGTGVCKRLLPERRRRAAAQPTGPGPGPIPALAPALVLRGRWPHQLQALEDAPIPWEPAQEEVGSQAAARAPASAWGRLRSGTIHSSVLHRPQKVARPAKSP